MFIYMVSKHFNPFLKLVNCQSRRETGLISVAMYRRISKELQYAVKLFVRLNLYSFRSLRATRQKIIHIGSVVQLLENGCQLNKCKHKVFMQQSNLRFIYCQVAQCA